jgi:DNA-binding NarL/FixJ family response regulator
MPADQLSSREMEVLQHIADGKTVRDTARCLKLAEITVKKYAADIRTKLEANTTPNAVATALRRGIID